MKYFLAQNRIMQLVFVLSIFMVSCERKWKKPADVSFGFQLNSNSADGLVKFTSGYFLLDKIDFNGDRKQGSNNVSFSKDYDPNAQIYLNSTALSGGLTFDIPQGTYTRIDLKVSMEEQPGNAPSLVVYGTYINTINDTIAVRFEFISGETFELQGQSTSGGAEIFLMEDKPSSTSIIFNPKYWFDVVPQSMLESATIVIESSVQTMIINDSSNSDIYELVIDRLSDGNQLMFN